MFMYVAYACYVCKVCKLCMDTLCGCICYVRVYVMCDMLGVDVCYVCVFCMVVCTRGCCVM